jgi:hypothetical protein
VSAVAVRPDLGRDDKAAVVILLDIEAIRVGVDIEDTVIFESRA